MRTYVCDWCKRVKQNGERWILGFAAERIGISGIQREFSIASGWSEQSADHRLAVHFCSEEHKNSYVTALFMPVVSNSGVTKRRRHTRKASRKNSSVDSADLGAVSFEIDLPPGVVASTPATNIRKPRRKTRRAGSAPFSDSDAIRSHGLGICLESGRPERK